MLNTKSTRSLCNALCVKSKANLGKGKSDWRLLIQNVNLRMNGLVTKQANSCILPKAM